MVFVHARLVAVPAGGDGGREGAMKLRDTAAGALAAWQAMTMTGASAPAPTAPAPAAPSTVAVSIWHSMTMTQPTAPILPPQAAPVATQGMVGGFTVGTPATS